MMRMANTGVLNSNTVDDDGLGFELDDQTLMPTAVFDLPSYSVIWYLTGIRFEDPGDPKQQ